MEIDNHMFIIYFYTSVQDASVSSVDSEVDLGELLTALDESLKEQNIAKVTEVKAMIEQGMLSLYAS